MSPRTPLVRVRTQVSERDTLDLVGRDGLWPWVGGLGGPEFEESQRHKAVAEVLCSIPQGDYEELKSESKAFSWFIPDHEVRGMVYPVPPDIYPEDETRAPYARVLYLSPMLEQTAWNTVLAVVAHELSHLVLGHETMTGNAEEYEAQEETAFRCICEWGFETEARRHRAVNRRRRTRERAVEQSMVRRLSAPKNK